MIEKLLSLILNKYEAYFSIEKISDFVTNITMGVLTGLSVLVLFLIIWKAITFTLNLTLKNRIDSTSYLFIITILKFVFTCMALVATLDTAGIKTSAILASLGVAGLTIGFAAKDALSNLISGVLIFIDRPFVLGDLVDIDGVYGKVEKITLRSTRVVTVDGKMYAVPNTEIINKMVASYTNFPNLRLDVRVTISPSEDISKVRNILLKIVNNDSDYMKEKEHKVVVAELNDYNICLEVQAWLKEEKDHVRKRFELRESIFNTLNDNNVEMPFETIQVLGGDKQ